MTAKHQTAQPRVYWLTTEFFPPQTGGTGIITGRLADALANCGFEVCVVTRQTEPRHPSDEHIGGVRVRRIGPAGLMKGVGWRAVPVMAIYLFRILVLLISEGGRYELAFISGMKTIPLVAVPICRLLGKKCVIRIESPFEIAEPISSESLATMNSFFGRQLNWILMRSQRFALGSADRVIAISDEIATRLSQLAIPSWRIARIPNAIDLTRFVPVTARDRQLLREKLQLPHERTLMLYVGRLSRSKGVMMLLQSLPGLVAKHADLLLVLVGSGQDSWDDCETEINEYVRKHRLETRVCLTGQSDHVHEYLQCADLFVSPSDYEGFGLTIVEALACGLPVVSTAVGVANEAIQHAQNGYLCSPRDPKGLHAAIELALSERARWEQIGRRARQAAAAFDVPRVISQYVDLCLRLSNS